MENIVRKGEIACNKQFLLFSQHFQSYTALIFNSKCTLKCRLQFVSIQTSLKCCRLVMGYETKERYTVYLPAFFTKPASASGLPHSSQQKHSGCHALFIALITRPTMNSPIEKHSKTCYDLNSLVTQRYCHGT